MKNDARHSDNRKNRRKSFLIKLPLGVMVIILLFITYLHLTKYSLAEEIILPDIPASLDDLDDYLIEREGQYEDIVPGAEKIILWADETPARTEYSVVFFHGFSSSRPELDPLPMMVADSLDANLFYTRLRGHGRTPEAFATPTANDWLNDTAEAMEIGRATGRQVILMGSSTGCLLALWLSRHEEYSTDVYANILLSANIYPANKQTRLFLYPLGTKFAQLVMGEEREWEPYNEGMAKYWNHKYNWKAVTPMIVLVEHIKKTVDLTSIEVPTLFLYTEKDEVVDISEIEQAYAALGSEEKRIRNLSEVTEHTMAGDIISPESTDLVYEEIMFFLSSVIPDIIPDNNPDN